jgi:hypothetical protein
MLDAGTPTVSLDGRDFAQLFRGCVGFALPNTKQTRRMYSHPINESSARECSSPTCMVEAGGTINRWRGKTRKDNLTAYCFVEGPGAPPSLECVPPKEMARVKASLENLAIALGLRVKGLLDWARTGQLATALSSRSSAGGGAGADAPTSESVLEEVVQLLLEKQLPAEDSPGWRELLSRCVCGTTPHYCYPVPCPG